MAEKLGKSELEKFKELLISVEELLISHSTHIDAVTQLLVEKGIITNKEVLAKLKQVRIEYQRRENNAGDNSP